MEEERVTYERARNKGKGRARKKYGKYESKEEKRQENNKT